MASSTLISDTQPWKELKAHVDEIKKTHLRDLLGDVKRCESMAVEFDGILLDYSRQQATLETVNKLFKLVEVHKQEGYIRRSNNNEIYTKGHKVLRFTKEFFKQHVQSQKVLSIIEESQK